MQTVPFLSVILPCYNPPGNWVAPIKNFCVALRNQAIDFELVIVNDGSTKNFDLAEVKAGFSSLPEVKILSYTHNAGKGHALRYGVTHAKGTALIYTDIDLPYKQKSFLEILQQLNDSQNDLVVGIRGDEYYVHLPAERVKLSKLLRWAIKKFLRLPTDDTQCGLKGFNQKGRDLFLQTTINRYLFDLEFVFLAGRNALTVKTVEVELRPEVELSSINSTILLQEAINFLKIFLKSIF